ncbi:uncharacterized protein [Ptychodera flava]|uniref:uncharacterized protein n=1 Tax=Ptychodera flava TaxID=63121 RepID=UPI003969D9D0
MRTNFLCFSCNVLCGLRMTRRVFAISDLHVDHPENLKWVENWSESYENDILIVAGDVTDSLPLLKSTLLMLKKKFDTVFYVPGNHELWVRKESQRASANTGSMDSIKKFNEIITMCEVIDVYTKPKRMTTGEGQDIIIVPLYSWYSTPEEDLDDSLYHCGPEPEDKEKMNKMWMDNHFCIWPKLDTSRSKYFAKLNEEHIKQYDVPVISFSHFLPRIDLVLPTKEEDEAVVKERQLLSLPEMKLQRQGAFPGFNFTRFAGCKVLETQIRQLGSKVHVHGHQHRNRDRIVNNVRYVSHCLGYRMEREKGLMWGLCEWKGPKQVWPLS